MWSHVLRLPWQRLDTTDTLVRRRRGLDKVLDGEYVVLGSLPGVRHQQMSGMPGQEEKAEARMGRISVRLGANVRGVEEEGRSSSGKLRVTALLGKGLPLAMFNEATL